MLAKYDKLMIVSCNCVSLFVLLTLILSRIRFVKDGELPGYTPKEGLFTGHPYEK